MGVRRRWWAVLLALLVVVGAFVLPGCADEVSVDGADESIEAVAEDEVADDDATDDATTDADAATDADATGDDATDDDAKSDKKSNKKADATTDDATTDADADEADSAQLSVSEDGAYTSKEEVALYLHTYGHLPRNYVTKDEAEDAGWKAAGLGLDEACPGMSIGGDRFGNREKRLPTAKGRTWYECDIDYYGGSRGAKRIVYSSDGLIYYTEDHYQTFEQLY